MPLRGAGIVLGDPRAPIVGVVVHHRDTAVSRVEPLGAHPAVTGRASLQGIAVVSVRLGQRHELPRAVDPHLASGSVGYRHGGRMPRGWGACQPGGTVRDQLFGGWMVEPRSR